MSLRPSSDLPAPRTHVAWALPAAFALVVHGRALLNGLTNWDDPDWVVDHPFAAQGLWRGLGWSLTRFHDDAYYPVTNALYVALHALAGANPLVHHAFQLALFAATAALLPRALASFGVRPGYAFWATLVWLAHPFRVESVAWAANLKDTASLFFAVAAFAALRRSRPLAAALFALAVGAKTSVAPLALLVPLVDWKDGQKLGRSLLRAWPFLVPAAALTAVTAHAHLGGTASALRSHPGGSLAHALPSVLWLPWRYLGTSLWPAQSLAIPPFEPVGLHDPRFFVAAGLLAASAAVLFSYRRRRWLLVGAAAFVLPLLPVIGLVPLAFPVADRYALLPSIPLFLAAIPALRLLFPAKVTAVALAAVAVGFGARAFERTGEWHDSVKLWEADKAVSPKSWAVRVNLAGAYGGEGRWDDAIAELEAARSIDPTRYKAPRGLIFAYLARANAPMEKIHRCVSPIDDSNGSADGFLASGLCTMSLNQTKPARVAAETVLASMEHPAAHALLAKVDLAEDKPAAALEHAHLALNLPQPAESARVELVLALASLGRTEEALQAADVPVQDEKTKALLLGARGFALFKAGREDEAKRLLDASNQLLRTQQQ